MNSITFITIASLAMANAAILPSSNGTLPRANWIDVCNYQDPSGYSCCPPGMEGHKYLMVPESIGWVDQAAQCQ